MRRGFAAFVLLALFVVLARPACDVLQVAGDYRSFAVVGIATAAAAGQFDQHDDESGCCSSVHEAGLTPSFLWLPPAEKYAMAAIAPAAVFSPWAEPASVAGRGIPRVRPPIQRPYHVRSLRLLI